MYEYSLAGIKSIYDGDTFIAKVDLGFGVTKEEKFRMAHINTPELKLDTYEAGKASRDYFRNRMEKAFIDNKQIIVKTFRDSKGKYGRYIAEVFIEGVSIFILNSSSVITNEEDVISFPFANELII